MRQGSTVLYDYVEYFVISYDKETNEVTLRENLSSDDSNDFVVAEADTCEARRASPTKVRNALNIVEV